MVPAMELVNPTPAVAYLFPVNLLEPEIRAAVIVKKTYVLDDDFRAREAEDRMPLVSDRLDNDFGVFHGDIFFRKRGVDLCVLGTIRLDRPTRRTNLRIEHLGWHHEMRVTGDRVWRRVASGDLAPSGPEPFQEMPVTYARAYGGTADVDGESLSYPDNPMGRGYYESIEQAIDRPLPNLEPIAGPGAFAWNARVPVVGWGPYPMFWGLRPAKAVSVDNETGELIDLTPEIFNQAHPDLIIDDVDPSAPFVIRGLRSTPVHVVLPNERPKVMVTVGNQTFDVVGDPDGIYIWIDARRLVVTWRCRFRYPVQTEQIRRAHLSFVE
jgi:hypothetical protein